MTELQLMRRSDILDRFLAEHRDKYTISLFDSFIEIHNNQSSEGYYTDNLQSAKRWLHRNIKYHQKKKSTDKEKEE